MSGNIQGMPERFRRGEASPQDVSDARGYSLIRVSIYSFLLFINGFWHFWMLTVYSLGVSGLFILDSTRWFGFSIRLGQMWITGMSPNIFPP